MAPSSLHYTSLSRTPNGIIDRDLLIYTETKTRAKVHNDISHRIHLVFHRLQHGPLLQPNSHPEWKARVGCSVH